jgi:hypothetical protein
MDRMFTTDPEDARKSIEDVLLIVETLKALIDELVG